MSLLKNIYYDMSSLLPMQLLKSISSHTTLLPYHHTVSSSFLPHIGHLYSYKNERQFISDLDLMLKHFTPVTVADLIEGVHRKKTMPKQSFLFSFDDGFREVHDIIAPILEKKGVPAIFFINPAFLDNKVLFYRCKISLLIDALKKEKDNASMRKLFQQELNCQDDKLENIIASLKRIHQATAAPLSNLAGKIGLSFETFLLEQKPFLTSPQLVSLHKRGFDIGAHSMNHPYYQLLPLNEQISQTLDSCKAINDMLGTEKCCFSFPHSDAQLSQALMDEISKAGVPLLFGIQNQKDEIVNNMLHRFNAERPEIGMDTQLKGLIFMMLIRRILGKNKVLRN